MALAVASVVVTPAAQEREESGTFGSFKQSPFHPLLILTEATRVQDDFKMVGKKIGQGKFGIVRRVVKKTDNSMWACKTIAKRSLEVITGFKFPVCNLYSAFRVLCPSHPLCVGRFLRKNVALTSLHFRLESEGNEQLKPPYVFGDVQTEEHVEAVRTEVAVMEQLRGHANIIERGPVYEDADSIHIVMELCTGGDLFGLLRTSVRFSEAQASWVLRKVVGALAVCHARGLVHRDLKPENILLSVGPTGRMEPKLADFGLTVVL